MDQLEGFVQKGKEHLVCKVKKKLYMLKQLLKVWYHHIDSFFINQGFCKCQADDSLYVKQMGEYLLLAILYVGDWIILTTNITKLKWLKSKPENEYEINDLNELHYCPGMELERNRETRTITMNQKNYINEVFKHFNMEECKPVKTPIDVTLKLLKLWNVQREMGGVPYKAGIGITPRYPHSCRRLLPCRPCHIPLMKVSSPT